MIFNATKEIHHQLEGEDEHVEQKVAPTFGAVILQVMLLDIDRFGDHRSRHDRCRRSDGDRDHDRGRRDAVTAVWPDPLFAFGADLTSGVDFSRRFLRFVTPAPLLALSAIAVPTGLHDGFPVGVQVHADRVRDDWALQAATVIEEASPTLAPVDPLDLRSLGMVNAHPQPLGGNEMPRFGGPGTFMRLPGRSEPNELDVGIVGVPFDLGTSWRPGARFGPRAIRNESVLIRPYNMATRAAPFDSLRIDDLGDVAVNAFDKNDSVARIESHHRSLLGEHDIVPVTLGGDHTIVLPILRVIAARYGPVGLVHVDAHTDINDEMFGERIAHGTPFRRAVEEGLLDTERVAQIGVRATGYAADDFDWSREQGFRVVQAEECWHRSLEPLMAEIRDKVGGGPVYLSFDIDGIDPAFAPGTGTPEIAGLTVPQAVEIIRGCRGLDLIGCDMVEVAPAYDTTGTTALTAANLVYEMLCVLPGATHR